MLLGNAFDNDVLNALEDSNNVTYALVRESDLVAFLVLVVLFLAAAGAIYAVASYYEARRARRIAEATHALLREALARDQDRAPPTFAESAARFLKPHG